jgi:ABC-type antimicrobial peptide transport system ATPase subunit
VATRLQALAEASSVVLGPSTRRLVGNLFELEDLGAHNLKGLVAPVQGMTMLVVTHEMGFARDVADDVVFIDRGAVVERAPPEAMFASPREPRTRAFLERLLEREGGQRRAP